MWSNCIDRDQRVTAALNCHHECTVLYCGRCVRQWSDWLRPSPTASAALPAAATASDELQHGGGSGWWDGSDTDVRTAVGVLSAYWWLWSAATATTAARRQRLDDENVKFRKFNMADGRHFENHYISISQPQLVRISRNLVCGQKVYPRRGNVTKNHKFRNSRRRTDAILKIIFLVITRLHRVQLRRNLVFRGIIARTRKLVDENVQLRKSNMADGRHFENHYIPISQPQIVQIARNLVCRHKFYCRRQKRQTNQKFANSKCRMDMALKITFWL